MDWTLTKSSNSMSKIELEVQMEVIGIPLDKLLACQSTRFPCSVARAVQKSIKTCQVSKYGKIAPENFRFNRWKRLVMLMVFHPNKGANHQSSR